MRLPLLVLGVAALAACGGVVEEPLVCDAPQSACGDVCADLQSSGEHCGKCGHDCFGGKCEAGVCQAAPIAQGLASPYGIAVDGENVYFTTTDGRLLACPVAGCGAGPVTFASNLDQPRGIATDGKNIYFTTSSAIMTCSVGGCGAGPAVFASGQADPEEVTLDAARVYWTNHLGDTVMSCPISGCGGAPTVIASNQAAALGIAVDSKQVYWGNSLSPGGSINACPLGGPCTPVTIAADQPLPTTIVVSNGQVFWANFSGSAVMTCPTTGCGGKPTPFLTLAGDYDGLAADAENLYVINNIDSTGALLRCPLSGCGAGPAVLAADQDRPGKVALDATSVYWTVQNAGMVMRLAK